MNSWYQKKNRRMGILITIAMCLSVLSLGTASVSEAATPRLKVGTASVIGSPISLAMTSKYKNKSVKIEIGTLVKKKLKYTTLTSVRLSSTGSATFCTQRVMPSTAVLRVKSGTKVIATTKTKTRSNIAACPIAAPASLDLQGVSDSGVSAEDNITNATELAITGTAYPNSTVSLIDGGVDTGITSQADSSGVFSISVNSSPSEGVHTYTAKASIAGVVSTYSQPLSVSVDRTKPTVAWTWEESKIGPNCVRHTNLVPSEPIVGFELADVKPIDASFTQYLTFGSLVKTGENYRFNVTAVGYETTDLNLWMMADAVTDIAGNESAGTNTWNFGQNAGRRFTLSNVLPLDIYRPELVGGSLEHVDTVVDYGKILFSFDEEVYGLQIGDLGLREWQDLGNSNWSDQGFQPLSNYSTDGVLHTTNNKDFWVGITDLQHYFFGQYRENGLHYEVIPTGEYADEFGNSTSGANYGAFIN